MSVRNAILGLLADHPRHGYELRAAFEALAGGEDVWAVKPAQVYTTPRGRHRKGWWVMGFNPKDAVQSAKDIASYAVEMSGDIVDNAVEVLKGNVAEGTTNIVQDSLDIAGHSVQKAGEILTGRKDDEDDEK